jgi:cathepsin B
MRIKSRIESKILIVIGTILLLVVIYFSCWSSSIKAHKTHEGFDYINDKGHHQAVGTILRNNPAVEKKAQTYRTVAPVTPPNPLPTNFDGTQVWGNLLTPIGDQGACGSCWAYSTSYALADRYAIFSLGQIKFIPSATELAECAHNFGSNIEKDWGNVPALMAMDDDSLYDALEVLYDDGVPDINCFPNKFSSNGKQYDMLKIEDPTTLPYCYTIEGIDFDTCADGVTAMKKYRSQTSYNIQSNETAIKTDIYRFGPIATGIQVFEDFMTWSGTGIYTHPDTSSELVGGHAVSVVGWGEETQDGINVPYWLIRNSWGISWGMKGFFKMQRNLTDIQLEQNCCAMIPDAPGFTITVPDIIPLETIDDINIHKFTQHYIDPITGLYTSGLEKVATCALKSKALPYISPEIPLPVYEDFWAYQVSKWIAQLPSPVPSNDVSMAICGSPYPLPPSMISANINIVLPLITPSPSSGTSGSTPSNGVNSDDSESGSNRDNGNNKPKEKESGRNKRMLIGILVLILILLVLGSLMWNSKDQISSTPYIPLTASSNFNTIDLKPL